MASRILSNSHVCDFFSKNIVKENVLGGAGFEPTIFKYYLFTIKIKILAVASAFQYWPF